jgi:hypothetical protein
MNSQLGAGMQVQLWEIFSDQMGHAHILNNHAVGVEITDQRQTFERIVQVALLDERIEGDENAAAEVVGIADHLIECFFGKVAGFRPGGKAGESGIDRVGSVGQCGPGGFRRSGGSE